jgi:hypothetical protein
MAIATTKVKYAEWKLTGYNQKCTILCFIIVTYSYAKQGLFGEEVEQSVEYPL